MFLLSGRFLPLTFLLIVGLGALPWCQPACVFSSDGMYVTCKGENLYAVPQNFSEDLVYLDLSYNKISEIKPSDFSQYPKLDVINLSYNNISVIQNGTFQYNLFLRNLSLFNNCLAEIPSSSLESLDNLKILDLSNNFYRHVTLGDVFYRLVNLQEFSIGGPLVSEILKDDFASIQNITLKKFSLKSKSSLDYYEPGAFSLLDTQILWLDIALDANATFLIHMLKDLENKTLTSIRFRNLFENSYYSMDDDIFFNLQNINLTDLSFYRGKFNEKLLRIILLNVQRSSIINLYLYSIDFARSPDAVKDGSINDLNLRNLVIQDVTNPDILRFDWTFTWFSKITNLSIRNVNFNFVPCDAWGQMTNLVNLDISSNRLLASYLYNLLCKDIVLPNIEVFNASDNEMRSLRTLSLLTAQWPRLTQLDLSSNNLGSNNEVCEWKSDIRVLILRFNILLYSIFNCLPTTLEYLDLSNSNLDRLDMNYFKKTQNLQELILSNNKIKFIPSGWYTPNLQVLALEGNSFGSIDKGSFHNLQHLKILTAGNNPYHCTCDLYTFFSETLSAGSPTLPDWPKNYYCYHPEQLLDTRVASYSPGKLECNVGLVVAISVSITAVVVIAAMLLCWRFDVPWYIRATFQIIRSKYRSKNDKPNKDYAYHAFISYSYFDAEWVRGVLLPHLETANPPYQICIHERDFQPGRWIIDNIIENIENSRKIIFVLSHNFINSEWCNYELYFAHQRAIGHAFEDVILVVKEAVSMEDLPKRFHRLRKMLRTKTYLEWPLEENRQPFFWLQLKSILGKSNMGVSGLDNVSVSVEGAISSMEGSPDEVTDSLDVVATSEDTKL